MLDAKLAHHHLCAAFPFPFKSHPTRAPTPKTRRATHFKLLPHSMQPMTVVKPEDLSQARVFCFSCNAQMSEVFILFKFALTYQTLPRNLPRCEGYLPRACFYIRLYKCFRGPSAGKLFLETEEGSFREGIRTYGLLGNKHLTEIKLLCANQKGLFRELPREKQPSANLPRSFRDCSAAPHFWLIRQHLYMFA